MTSYMPENCQQNEKIRPGAHVGMIHTFTGDIAQIQLIGVKSVKTIPSKNKLKVIEQNRRVTYQLFFREQILIQIGPKQYYFNKLCNPSSGLILSDFLSSSWQSWHWEAKA